MRLSSEYGFTVPCARDYRVYTVLVGGGYPYRPGRFCASFSHQDSGGDQSFWFSMQYCQSISRSQ